MSNLKEVKPAIKKITLNDGVEREIKFDLNAMAELEDKYGSVEAAFEAMDKGSIKAVRCVLWAGLLHADENLTEKQVGSLIDTDTLTSIMNGLSEALEADMPGQDTPGLPNA